MIGVLAGWAAFTAWCLWAFPPCVDLPAHGAQMQLLAQLISGDPEVSSRYEVHLALGYGLPYWLFLPLTLATNGAVAVRVALWTALQLYPLSLLALARVFRRPDWTVLLGLPLTFNISYWYGLLPGYFAQPLLFFAIAACVRALEAPSRRRWGLFTALATAVLLSHLVAFVALGVVLAALAAVEAQPRRALRQVALGLALPAVLSLSRVLFMAGRAVEHGPWAATEYGLPSHLSWFFVNYRPEGTLLVAGPLLVTLAMLVTWLSRRKVEVRGPAAMFAALVALYLVTPRTLSGVCLVSVRIPALAGVLALMLVDASRLARTVRVGLVLLGLLSLAQVARFHARFAAAVDGLQEMVDLPPAGGQHGYLSLVGRQVLGSRNVYLAHLGQWWTARWGGPGHDFFADADHFPVRFRPGEKCPPSWPPPTPPRGSASTSCWSTEKGRCRRRWTGGWRCNTARSGGG